MSKVEITFKENGKRDKVEKPINYENASIILAWDEQSVEILVAEGEKEIIVAFRGDLGQRIREMLGLTL